MCRDVPSGAQWCPVVTSGDQWLWWICWLLTAAVGMLLECHCEISRQEMVRAKSFTAPRATTSQVRMKKNTASRQSKNKNESVDLGASTGVIWKLWNLAQVLYTSFLARIWETRCFRIAPDSLLAGTSSSSGSRTIKPKDCPKLRRLWFSMVFLIFFFIFTASHSLSSMLPVPEWSHPVAPSYPKSHGGISTADMEYAAVMKNNGNNRLMAIDGTCLTKGRASRNPDLHTLLGSTIANGAALRPGAVPLQVPRPMVTRPPQQVLQGISGFWPACSHW